MANENEDLGLGERVVQENRSRFLKSDGNFNVYRKGVFEHGAFSPYHALLNMSWPRFYSLILGSYLLANFIFTGLYLLCGPGAFLEMQGAGLLARFGAIFFFSVHIITTIGESGLTPADVASKVILSIEAMTGLLGFAIAAGVIFARFSNPATKIHFSEKALIAPYKDMTAFMTRIINGRSNELIDVKAVLTLALAGADGGRRRFHQLKLERDGILIFPLSWTIVHPITKESPLHGLTLDDLKKRNAEFIIALSAVDQDISRTVYVRHSYIPGEMLSGVRFANILENDPDGTIFVDPARIGEIENTA